MKKNKNNNEIKCSGWLRVLWREETDGMVDNQPQIHIQKYLSFNGDIHIFPAFISRSAENPKYFNKYLRYLWMSLKCWNRMNHTQFD